MRMRSGRPVERAFTLIELLVVVAVIALLIGLLVPVISSARRSAGLVQSLSNLRQMTIAAASYSTDNQDLWPILPSGENLQEQFEEDTSATAPFFEWGFGGKNTARWWQQYESNFVSAASDRPLNLYLYPDLDLTNDGVEISEGRTRGGESRANNIFVDELRTELNIYECPGDFGTLARRENNRDALLDNNVGTHFPFRQELITGYDDVGTSYVTNRHHVLDLAEEVGIPSTRISLWINAARSVATATGIDPSRFAWVHDQVVWQVPHFGVEPGTNGLLGNFNEVDHGTAGFMDGSSKYVPVQQRNEDTDGRNLAIITRDYHLSFTRFRGQQEYYGN
ncbi:MAG: type II secretion system protein [Planctomycetota bacterium]